MGRPWKQASLRWGKTIYRDAPADRKAAGTCCETCLGVCPFLREHTVIGSIYHAHQLRKGVTHQAKNTCDTRPETMPAHYQFYEIRREPLVRVTNTTYRNLGSEITPPLPL